MTSKRLNFLKLHLITSLCIGIIIFSWIYFVWYPFPLTKAVGVNKILYILFVVDIFLGPLLSFIVYRERKKTLKLDLTIIVLIQLSALLYGIYTIEKARPLWSVFYIDRFELIRKNDVALDIKENNNLLARSNVWSGPVFSAVKPSDNAKQRQEDMFFEVMGGGSIAQIPQRYIPLKNVRNDIKVKAKSIVELNDYNDPLIVSKTIKKYPEANAWLPLKANIIDMVVLINKENAEVVKIVDLRPWN